MNTPEWHAFDETHLWLPEETKAAYERLRRASAVAWPTPETRCPTRIHVAGYRPTALSTLPLKRGTARRLGIRHPYQAYPQRVILGVGWEQQDLKPCLDALDRLNRQVALASLGFFRPVRHVGGVP